MTTFRTRFAPSPTGRLHLGHAASAKYVWEAAEKAGGTALLRIEDIDTTRCRAEFTQAIYEDLHWLGFEWPQPVRVQSEHFPDYAACVEALAARGLAYRCFKTRAEIAALSAAPKSGGTPVYRGQALPRDQEAGLLDAKLPFAWRLSLAACQSALGPLWDDLAFSIETERSVHFIKAEPERHGDIVIARKDSPSAYHLAATYDDALQGMTHLIRGQDLVDAPHIQTLLQVLMDWPRPIYRHHPLVLGPEGQRLSKSVGSQSLAELRAAGMTVKDIWDRVGFG